MGMGMGILVCGGDILHGACLVCAQIVQACIPRMPDESHPPLLPTSHPAASAAKDKGKGKGKAPMEVDSPAPAPMAADKGKGIAGSSESR